MSKQDGAELIVGCLKDFSISGSIHSNELIFSDLALKTVKSIHAKFHVNPTIIFWEKFKWNLWKFQLKNSHRRVDKDGTKTACWNAWVHTHSASCLCVIVHRPVWRGWKRVFSKCYKTWLGTIFFTIFAELIENILKYLMSNGEVCSPRTRWDVTANTSLFSFT